MADKIDSGLIRVLTAVEPCWSFGNRRDRAWKKLVLVNQQRKCMHLYHYLMHEELGLMHAVRIRHRLNDRVLIGGGHLGYYVRRSHRCRGHATAAVQQAVALLGTKGVNDVLVTTSPANPTRASWSIDTGSGDRRDRGSLRPSRGPQH